MPDVVEPFFVRKSLSDGNWTLLSALGIPRYVKSLELRDATSACQFRNSDEEANYDDYAQNEVFRLPPSEDGVAFDTSKIQIKGTAADSILGEYHL